MPVINATRAVAGLAVAAVLLTGTPATAEATSSVRAQLLDTVVPCSSQAPRPDDVAAMSRCARDLVAPDTRIPYIFDLFRTFTYCLLLATNSDSMYPGAHPREVNRCLEDHGF